MLATLIELTSLMRIDRLLLGGVKRADVPDTIRWPRPGEVRRDDGVRTMTPREFARAYAQGAA